MAGLSRFSVAMVLALLVIRGGAGEVNLASGESITGTIHTSSGESLEVVEESGAVRKVALADVAQARIGVTGKPWQIAGMGVLTSNGSFLAESVIRMDGRVVSVTGQRDDLLLTVQNTSALFFQSLRSRDAEALRFDRQGVLLKDGDFMEGTVMSVGDGRVTVDSLLLGRKSFPVGTEAVAVVLRKPVNAPEAWTLKLKNGSRLRCKEVKTGPKGVTLHDSPYRNYHISLDQLVELQKGRAEPLIELFRSRWIVSSGGRPLAVAALGDEATLVDLDESREAMERKRVEREAAMNQAKAEWIRSQQIATRLKAVSSREAGNVNRMQAQVRDKIRRVEQDQRMVQQAGEDIERKMRMVEQAKTKVKEAREKLSAIPPQDAAQRRSGEQHVRNAERQKQNAERIVSQARATQRRHETRAKSSQRLVDMAQQRVVQAKEKREKDDLAHKAAEEGLVAAKSSYDLTSADLREAVEELRRLDFLIQRKRNAGGE